MTCRALHGWIKSKDSRWILFASRKEKNHAINNIFLLARTEKNRKIFHFVFIQTQQNLHKNESPLIALMRSSKVPDKAREKRARPSWHHQQTQLGYLIQFSYSFYVFTEKHEKKSTLKFKYFGSINMFIREAKGWFSVRLDNSTKRNVWKCCI